MIIGWLSFQFVFYDQQRFCLVALATLNIEKKKKKFFLNDSSTKTTLSSVANFFTANEESIKQTPIF